MPVSVRNTIIVCKSMKYIWYGLRTLCKGKMEVSVLDGTAIAVSLLRGETKTMGANLIKSVEIQ